eukprot:TRINITY_DN8162_c0_g2_i1.p1 TRINITY_DN8162_c0_g2~~TRINITY_DN8162_c0_g2_i1.p1  ORF type:complete len:461 (+),score=131.93 TRINITY_DN8162_c0_g2_i1:34-1416(+)
MHRSRQGVTALLRVSQRGRNSYVSKRFCSEIEKAIAKQKKEAEEAQRRNDLIMKNAKSVQSDAGQGTGFEDITEFMERNADQITTIRKEVEDAKEPNTTMLQFGSMFGKWVVTKAKNTKEWVSMSSEERKERRAARKEAVANNRATADVAMASFYQSQELINLMKFKGVTFDSGKEPGVPAADFEGFSRRVCDNYDVFKKTEAYSNLEFHVVKDPSKGESKFEKHATTNYREIDEGALTGWLTQEQEVPEAQEDKKETEATNIVRPPPFKVDYVTGEVTVLDTCSPEEFLDFLEREAPRAELRQVAIFDEQVKMHEEIQKLVEKTKLETIVYNGGQSSLTDKEYKKLKAEGNEKNYVLPSEVLRAVEEINKAPRLYLKHLKGTSIRLLPVSPARAYFVDVAEKQVCIPKDFYKDTFLPVHKKYKRYQKIEFFVRKLRFLGWMIVITLLGDVEWPAMWPLV